MNKIILILLIFACLITGCHTGIKPQKAKIIKPIPYSELAGIAKTNLTVKTNLNLVTSEGKVVKVPVITTNSPVVSTQKVKQPEPQQFIIVYDKPVTEPAPAPVKQEVVPQPVRNEGLDVPKVEEPKKKDFWEKYKTLIGYYISVGLLAGALWFAYNSLFNKKKIKSKLIQTGHYQSVSTGGSGSTGTSGCSCGVSGCSCGVSKE